LRGPVSRTRTMKLYSRGPGLVDVAARSDESIALQRPSDSPDVGADLSSFSDDDDELDGYLDRDVIESIQTAKMDGGREARKVLLAAWLVDFMTSGECACSPQTRED
jgi:hypothetical protein